MARPARSGVTALDIRFCVVLIAALISMHAAAWSSIAARATSTNSQAQLDDPDALYVDRETPASARRAIEIWQGRLASNPNDVESGWKLARAFYWMGTNGPGSRDEKKDSLRAGIDAARKVAAVAPRRPEGHFWLAANMGALAESYGVMEGIRYRGAIREALETVLEIDPAYLQGSADRALGRWYYKVPRLFGGNKRRSAEHLEKALTYNANSIITRLFLAETLIDLDRKDEARAHVQAALAAPLDPAWAPEDRRFKEQAQALLDRLR